MRLDAAREASIHTELFDRISKGKPLAVACKLDDEIRALFDGLKLVPFDLVRGHLSQIGNSLLTSIVQAHQRPSIPVGSSSFRTSNCDSWDAILEEHKASMERAIPAVGRIELNDGQQRVICGSGFLVRESVIVTNRHVALEFANRDGGGFAWRTGRDGRKEQPRVDFRGELRSGTQELHRVTDVLQVEPDGGPDMAFLRIEGTVPGARSLSLGAGVAMGELVAAIGFPSREDDASNELQQIMDRIFEAGYDVKRISPGKVVGLGQGTFWHDCTTLGGSSGSAVVDIETGEVAGLHCAGDIDTNIAVSAGVVKERLSSIR